MNRTSRITLAVLVAVIAVFLTARLRYRGEPPARLGAQNCDAELWKHVYERERLRVNETCTAVEGRVVSLHYNSDGDVHIGLEVERKSVLNLFNVIHGRGELVAEVICHHTPSKSSAQAACGGFHSPLAIPKAGDRVRITGSYVTDRDNGWNEIHPVTRIEVVH